MAGQAFTRNHRDHSNDHGFQFEFYCDKCGNGMRSSFQTSSLGMAASMLKAAGRIFGGNLRGVGMGAEHVKDALRGPAHDSAFKEAVEELRPKFRQCTRCGKWVCPEVCWNHPRGLCEECAPDLGEHAPAIQAEIALEQAKKQAREADQLRGMDLASAALSAAASCAKCQATLSAGARFCPQCGTSAPAQASAATPKFCAQCGGALAAGARFCAQCGQSVG